VKENKKLYFIIALGAILGVALRIYLIFKPGYLFDIGCFLSWGSQIKDQGFWALYGGDFYQNIDYPPFIPLLSSLWFRLVGSPSAIFYKILPTIFEIGLIIAGLSFAIKSKLKYKNFLVLVILLQPALALVTSAWGQVDAILSLLIILGFIFYDKNLYTSSLFLFLAFLSKPQAVIAVFVYFLCLLLKKEKKDFFKQFIFWVIALAVIFAVFRFLGQSNFFDSYTKSVGRYNNLSLNAFNLWWLIFSQKAWTIIDTSGPYKIIGLILFAIFEIPVLFYVLRNKIDSVRLMILVAYSYAVFFVFPSQIHERYLFPSIALLAIPASFSKKMFFIYVVLTVSFLYNCFAVLESVYPQFGLNAGNLLLGFIPVLASLLNVGVVIFFAYLLIKNEDFKGVEKK